MNKTLLFAISIILSKLITAQNPLHCGADEMRISTLKQNPEIAKAVINRDTQLESFTQSFLQNANQTISKTTTTATYVIPVVFHVIHNYGTENISDAQLKDGIDIVNKTFRKLHPNNSSIVSAFQPIHADCDIEFRLATLDPNGNCTSGINRIASSLTSSGDHRVKNLIHWPPTQYLNVYVVANAAGLAGHAVWPSDADTIPLWDGIVLSHNYVGTIGTSNLTQSVAFAHECGHYLNLHHIWGGNNVPNFYYYPCADPAKDCNIDDLVADTPPTIGWQSCNVNGASCGNVVDNVQNAMDYSYCNIMFTDGQKTRMTACLNSPIAGRNNLWQTSNLIATGTYTSVATLCKANFMSNKTMVCPSASSVTFTNTSYNGTFTSVEWLFPGGTPSTSSLSNPTIAYSTPGSYNVQLKVKNGTDSSIIVKQNYINVQSNTGLTYPFSESFETITSLHGLDWYSNNLDTSNTWIITNMAAATGSASIMIDNFNSGLNGKDELYSRAINLSGASALNVSFKYAFARKDSTNNDQLILYGLASCNGSAIPRYTASGTALETTSITTAPFFPSAADWRFISAPIISAQFTSGFRLKFLFNGNRGNNIFIDDINLDITTGTKDISETIESASIFPNPATNNCSVQFDVLQTKTLAIDVFNLLGEKVYTISKNIYEEGSHEVKLNISNLSNGMYIVQINDGTRAINKQLVISK